MFGAADRNNDNRRAERKAYKNWKEGWREEETIRKKEHKRLEEGYELDIQQNENQLRLNEKGILQEYNQAVERQNYQYDRANEAFGRSLDQAEAQVKFNAMAEHAALMEQQIKKKDDLLSVVFDEADSLLDYAYGTAGLRINKNNKFAEAAFNEARIDSKYAADIGAFGLERRKAQSDSQIEAQKAIVEGMKAVGQMRSRGNAGRSSTKAVLGIMAESGATRAAIANGLMYAEQGIDLGIAQLKDMLILDQTMVLAARDMANNDYEYNSAKFDATLETDKIKLSATRQSIEDRDQIVRQNISLARRQADMQAANSILLMPTRLPELTDPREFYAEYDDPETADYVEMLLRPRYQDFPDYVPAPELSYEGDFHYSLGRENVAASNFGDALKIGGMAAGVVSGVGGLAAGGLFGAGGAIGSGTFLANSASAFGTISTGLSSLSSSFYPRQR
jgi:hypothetical protein